MILLALMPTANAEHVATSTRFSPLVLSLNKQQRIQGAFDFQSSPSGELSIAYLYKLYDGFDVGVGIHGGLLGGNMASGIFGFDVVLRYVRAVNDYLFLGIQTQGGYVYSGLGDKSISENFASSFPITIGAVIGGVVRESTQLYFFPAVELGRAANAGDPLWKTGIGLQLAVGTVIAIHDDFFAYLETQPTFANLNSNTTSGFQSFRIGLTLGVLYDF